MNTKGYLKAWAGTALAVVILFALTAGSDYLLANRPVDMQQGPTQVEGTPLPAGDVTVSGRFICLPHKDTTGPQTKECASGLAGDDGRNYALDLSTVTYPAGLENVRVTGHFVPTEALSTDFWQKYDMVGIISVTAIEPL